MNLTQNEVLDALRAALALPEASDGITATEICTATGRSSDIVRKWLLREVQAKRVECIRVKRTRVDGVSQMITGYRIVG